MRSLKFTDLTYVTILCKIKISVKGGGGLQSNLP